MQSSNVLKDVGFEARSLGSRALLLFCSMSNFLKARKFRKEISVVKTLRDPLSSALTRVSLVLAGKMAAQDE